MSPLSITLHINQQTTQLAQLAAHFGLEEVGNELIVPSEMGTGFIRYYALPYGIQVHHYQYCLRQEIEIKGQNEEADGLYMINLNLSPRLLKKQVGEQPVQLSEAGGSGMLFYSPGYHSQGKNEMGGQYEVVFFAFPQSTFRTLQASNDLKSLDQLERFCIYDELTPELDQSLRTCLNQAYASLNTFQFQGKLLMILGQIIAQFSQRKNHPSTNLNRLDIERQFQVKEVLLGHIYGQPPSIPELAAQVNMSPSKLKSDFKSLFGQSVYQYYLYKKMETAKQLLATKRQTISEIGYQLGYSNISQFSAQFKKQIGVSPSQYLA